MTKLETVTIEVAKEIFLALIPGCAGDPTKTVLARYDAVHHAKELVSAVRTSPQSRKRNDINEQRMEIITALQESGLNVRMAAESLGLSKQGFYNRVKRHGLQGMLKK